MKDNKVRLLTSFKQKFLKNLSIITVHCKKFCKIFTQTKLTDVLYDFMLYFLNIQENIL